MDLTAQGALFCRSDGRGSCKYTHHPPAGTFNWFYPLPCANGETASTKGPRTGPSRSEPGTDGASSRIHDGDRDGREQRGDTGQERFDGTGRRQVEENPVFVLFDLRRHFEEREDQRGGLRGGQGGVR